VEESDLFAWEEDFEAFCARFRPLFFRAEPRAQAGRYLRGLLAPVERKNGWQLAEAVGATTPDATQRLLYEAIWEADAARDELVRFVLAELAHPDGILVLDETGFLKKGTQSAGVQRQYSGTAGKVENCQLGVFLSYWTPTAHVLVDRALYLPQSWCQDPDRCRAAKVPAGSGFATKAELGLAMLQRVLASGLAVAWITADEAYGDSAELRAGVAATGTRYVLAVSCTAPLWAERPSLTTGPRGGRRLAAEAPAWQPAAELVATWPPERWQRLTVGAGEKGPLTYDWAAQRVTERRDDLPGDELWLLARRSPHDPGELAYYLCHAPLETPLLTLAQVASRRYSIEQCFAEAKGEVGLDHYEVRHWHSWYRHITLAMMALAFLAWVRDRNLGQGGRSTAPN
jgi:SRSO17 transposase